MQSKNPTTIVHLKPRDSKFSKHDRSTMQNESIKVDETALETGSPKSYIAENEEKWQKSITYNWVKELSHSQESLDAQVLA